MKAAIDWAAERSVFDLLDSPGSEVGEYVVVDEDDPTAAAHTV